MRIGSLVNDGLDNIGIVTASRNTTYCSVFVKFLNAVNAEYISGWYNEEDLEVICK